MRWDISHDELAVPLDFDIIGLLHPRNKSICLKLCVLFNVCTQVLNVSKSLHNMYMHYQRSMYIRDRLVICLILHETSY